MVRGVVNLPNGTGRTLRVAVFARGAKADEAKAAGADVVGAEDLVEKVQGGNIDFDRCIATPDMMPLVGRLGKVLGPARHDAEPEGRHRDDGRHHAVKGAKGGSVEFRVEKAGIVQAGVGKAPLFRPHRRPDAEAAQADEAGWRLGEGREEPPRQDRSRRHGRRLHRPLLKGPTVIAYSSDPVAAPKVAVDFAKANEKFVILGGAMGKTALNVERREGARLAAVARRTARQARRPHPGAGDQDRAARRTRRRPSSRAWSRPMPQRAKRPEAFANKPGSNRIRLRN
jgi:hypothetical protein